MQNKPSENSHRITGMPGLFLPQKAPPEVKQLAPLPSLPEWANPSEALAVRVANPGFKARAATIATQAKEHTWKRRDIVISVGSLCILLLALLFTTRVSNSLSLNSGLDVRNDIGGSGILYPKQELIISYPTTERVINILVKPGDPVVPNQPLLQLDPSQLNAETTQAYNDLLATQNYLHLVIAKANVLTIALAEQEYDYAKNKYQALITKASSPTLRKGNLVSPIRGVVTSVTANIGEIFNPNTALVTIMDETKVIVHAKIPLAAIHRVKMGQSVFVVPAALISQHFTGVVTAIIPQADTQTDTFEMWVEVPNANRLLLPGMTAYVHVQNLEKAP